MPDHDTEELREALAVLRATNAAIPPGSTLESAKRALGDVLTKESAVEDPSAEKLALLADCVIEVAQLVATLVGAAAFAVVPTFPAGSELAKLITPSSVVLPPETPAVPVAEDFGGQDGPHQ